MKLKLYPLLMAVIAGLFLSSCNHKDLCYMEMRKHKLRVLYDWSEAPDANPRGMCVFFYSTENPGAYYRFDFDNIEGGEIELPAGKYELITYNNDTEIVKFSNTNSSGNHTAYTRDGDLLEPLYGNGVTSTATTSNGERVRITPDALWGCHVGQVTVDETGVTYTVVSSYDESRCSDCGDTVTDIQTIVLYPHDMLCHYTFEVRNVENAQFVSKISAALSGMSGTMNMADESLGTERTTLPLSAKADASSHKITGQFLTFGHADDSTIPHQMTFFVEMTDGSKYRIEGDSNLDVTGQVDNAPDRRHVHIIIDHLKLPEPGNEEESQWEPTVDDWGLHYEDLPV